MNPSDTFVAPGSSLPTKGSDKKFFMLIGLIVFIGIIIGGAFLLSGIGSSTKDQLNSLSIQLANLAGLTEESSDNLRLEDTINLNGELQLTLASDQVELASGLGLKTPDEKALAKYADASAVSELEIAKTNGTYDQIYKKIIVQKLSAITDLIGQIYDSSNNQTTQTEMQAVYNHYTELAQRLSDARTN